MRNSRQISSTSFKFKVKWLLEKSFEETVFFLWKEAQHLLVLDQLVFLG